MTIGRVFDFMCDVISCSPEQLRQTKTVDSITQDELMSRLSEAYGGGDLSAPGEYAVILWNDEKHTITDVKDQVARACKTTMAMGFQRAYETDIVGRSIFSTRPASPICSRCPRSSRTSRSRSPSARRGTRSGSRCAGP